MTWVVAFNTLNRQIWKSPEQYQTNGRKSKACKSHARVLPASSLELYDNERFGKQHLVEIHVASGPLNSVEDY